MDGYATVAEDAGQCSASEAPPVRPGDGDRFRARVSAPPPDTVVVASPGQAAALVEQARAREAALRAEAAAEVARLTRALRDQKKAHAAEIERLRAEHAAGLRRLVETHWRALNAGRAGTERPGGQQAEAVQGPQTRPSVRLSRTREWLSRITERG